MPSEPVRIELPKRTVRGPPYTERRRRDATPPARRGPVWLPPGETGPAATPGEARFGVMGDDRERAWSDIHDLLPRGSRVPTRALQDPRPVAGTSPPSDQTA